MIGAGSNANRGNSSLPLEMGPLLQGLPLEPISLGNQRHTRSVELRKVLGIPPGSMSEDHTFGTGIPKHFPPLASEGLKHFKEVVQDASRRASDRAKLFRESLFKLERCKGTVASKKRQRFDLHQNDRSNGTKLGTHSQISPHDIMNTRVEEREKQIGPNKRARSVVTDLRVDRSVVTPKQHIIANGITDSHQECSSGSFRFEEKIRRLPGGEGWESKNKKKRSVSAVGCRSISGETDVKRPLNAKLNSEAKSRTSDVQALRLKANSGIGFTNRMDRSLDPTTSDTTAAMVRSETESASLLVDRTIPSHQKIGKKTGNKPNLLKDNGASNTTIPMKSKVSRATRTSSIMLLDSSLKVTLSSNPLKGSQDLSSTNKVLTAGIIDERKRSGSMPHAVAQWVGQRPHKNSRMRRSNTVGPVSSTDETRNLFQNLSASEMNPGIIRFGSSDSPVDVGGVYSNMLKSKRELEHAGSPFGLSESEESGSGGTKVTSKGIDNEILLSATQKFGPCPFPVRKNKQSATDLVDPSRKGRSGKASVGGPCTPQLKVDNMLGPGDNLKSSSDKNKSKTGRPPTKKLSDRKSSRLFPNPNNGSAEFLDYSNDDREEIITAIKAARNAKSNACSSPFWKKMESVFTSVSGQDVSYLKRHLGYTEDLEKCLSRSLNAKCNMLLSDGNRESVMTPLSGPIETGRLDKGFSLYQRVLSALIEEDDTEEVFIHCDGKNMSLQYGSDDSHCGSCNFIDTDVKDRDKMECEAESNVNSYSQKLSVMDRISSNKSVSSNSVKDSSISSSLSSNGYWLGDNEVFHADLWLSGEICSNDVSQSNGYGIGMADKQYHSLTLDDKLVLELQSIGICPDPLPDLLEGEFIKQEINELKGGLSLQVSKKRKYLEKLNKKLHLGNDLDRRKMEHAAMDQLIEIAYRKRLSCRETTSSKASLRKMSKQVALSFIERTLARYRKFEDTGCYFRELGLQELIHSPLLGNYDTKSTDCVGSGTASNLCHDHDGKSGAIVSPSERYSESLEKSKRREVLIDEVIGSASSRVTSTTEHFAQVRGKKSDDEKDQKKVNIRSVSAVCSPSVSEPKSESRPKLKPKQRGHHTPTSDPCPSASSNAATNMSRAGVLPGFAPLNGIVKEADESIELQITDFDSFGLETDGQQDLDFFSNIDDDGHDTMGLEIPMDDLSDLHLVF